MLKYKKRWSFLRVISGKVRGLKLDTPKNEDVRPTTDRVKESLFNIISPYIIDSNVLDLFAGTGSLGIECLSRGASHATFVDVSKESINIVKIIKQETVIFFFILIILQYHLQYNQQLICH